MTGSVFRRRAIPTAIIAIALCALGSRVVAQQSTEMGIARVAPSPPAGAPPSQAAVREGDTLFQGVCAACHGAEGRGGPGGAVDLTKSGIAMAADDGTEIHDFLQVGRPEKGMPPFPVSKAQAASLSAKLRSLGFAAAAQRPTAGRAGAGGVPASILVGDAAAGKVYFNGPTGKCSSCHSVRDGDSSPAVNLAHIASKYPDPKALQNNMVLNRSFFWTPSLSKDVSAVVTYRDGRTVTGLLSSISDFKVILRDKDEHETVIERSRGEPRVEVKDRLQHHLDLLDRYHDYDIHNLTAYLATLK